jgi:UDP-N-acetylglucosamine transferase subunit ALG13
VIFVTIGTVRPFDRLVRAMDVWAAAHPDTPVFAQIGGGDYEPQHMDWARSLDPDPYAGLIGQAQVIVAHAGIGSLVTAGRQGIPIVLLPRRAALKEHVNDHQVATAARFAARPGVHVAEDEAGLDAAIAAALAVPPGSLPRLGPHAPEPFLARLRAFAAG